MKRWRKKLLYLMLVVLCVAIIAFVVFVVFANLKSIGIFFTRFVLSVSVKDVFTRENLWLAAKGIIFFFAFIFFCHGPLVWMGFLFSIEDGKGQIIYAKDRILTIKITYYGRLLDRYGYVVEDKKNNFLKPFRWFKNYFFGSLHVLGIPGIHNIDDEIYEWEKLNPMTGKTEPAKSTRGEFPLREFIPSISFGNLDVVGGQINVKIGPLIKITNPIKTATIARDWFPFFIDMMRGHIREFFAPLDFFRVMINKDKFGTDEVKDASSLSVEIMTCFKEKKVVDKIEGKEIEFSLLEFIERKYGIKILEFYVIDPDPTDSSKDLLSAISKPEKAKLDAREMVNKASGEADAFNKKREAMEKPGGRTLRTLEAIERSRLVTLGEAGKDIKFLINLKEDSSSGQKGGA